MFKPTNYWIGSSIIDITKPNFIRHFINSSTTYFQLIKFICDLEEIFHVNDGWSWQNKVKKWSVDQFYRLQSPCEHWRSISWQVVLALLPNYPWGLFSLPSHIQFRKEYLHNNYWIKVWPPAPTPCSDFCIRLFCTSWLWSSSYACKFYIYKNFPRTSPQQQVCKFILKLPYIF